MNEVTDAQIAWLVGVLESHPRSLDPPMGDKIALDCLRELQQFRAERRRLLQEG